jgi:hypothetical protein
MIKVYIPKHLFRSIVFEDSLFRLKYQYIAMKEKKINIFVVSKRITLIIGICGLNRDLICSITFCISNECFKILCSFIIRTIIA